MARQTVIERLRALVGRVIAPTPEAVEAGRVSLTRIYAVTDARELVVKDGERPTPLLLGWPVDLTYRGWSHPALEGYHSVVDKTVLLGAPTRPGRSPVTIIRAHLDYAPATIGRISAIEAEGPRLVFEDRAGAVLLAHGVYPRSDLVREIFSAAEAALRADRPAATEASLIKAGRWGGL